MEVKVGGFLAAVGGRQSRTSCSRRRYLKILHSRILVGAENQDIIDNIRFLKESKLKILHSFYCKIISNQFFKDFFPFELLSENGWQWKDWKRCLFDFVRLGKRLVDH